MPRNITEDEPLESFLTGLQNGEGGEVIADRIVDITDICEETLERGNQTLIKFGVDRNGLIAQIENRSHEASSSSHFYPEHHGIAGLVIRDNFLHWARYLGCDAMTLAETIADFTPEQVFIN